MTKPISPPAKLKAAWDYITKRRDWSGALTWPAQYAAKHGKARGVTALQLAAVIDWKLQRRKAALRRETVKRAPERERAKRVAKRRVAVSVATPAGVRLKGRPGYVTLRLSLPVATFDALVAVAQRRRVTSEMVAAQLIAELVDG